MANQVENPSSAMRFGAWAANLADKAANRIGATEPYVVIWWIFLGSVVASSSARLFGDMPGPLAYAVAIAGTAGCAWMWLFARALFRPAKPVELWAIAAVGGVMAVESFWALSGSASTGAGGEVYRIAENAASLICIAAIVMFFVEALSGVSRATPRTERLFRYGFVGVNGLIITIALVGVSGAGGETLAAQWKNTVLTGCAIGGVVASRAAIVFRRRYPLTETARRIRGAQTQTQDAASGRLARRIQDAVANEPLLATPGLKIADFAEALGEQEYKITQCITGQLGYRNFNQFINAHRVEHAKRILADKAFDDRSVSSVAYDCGFNSIGPFNRAFKGCAGITPSEFRAARKERAG